MFVVLINFPPIKAGKETEFEEWFAWSNQEFARFRGFVGRRLLKPIGGGNYAAILEFESADNFRAMHGSPEHDEAGDRVKPLLQGFPTPHFYQVVVE